jgi:hypothetical protein
VLDLSGHTSILVCILNMYHIKMGIAGHFTLKNQFKTFYFILKWAKARNLPCFIFIMLCFKTEVATPGTQFGWPSVHGSLFLFLASAPHCFLVSDTLRSVDTPIVHRMCSQALRGSEGLCLIVDLQTRRFPYTFNSRELTGSNAPLHGH